ncbi:D-alanyl-D-alanine carboxypeptidase family protein [Pararhodobacter sp.]|uniref:D-alanyl-D-alanine carboxypeptidase family protein n=1 Tax=Pararhodobacter sp. TaxID=2127056 RepID=UPI002AFF45D5|nr:D-alanyl-D-alanine carboxypeptidase family protein [Pararhodobacter sp.]
MRRTSKSNGISKWSILSLTLVAALILPTSSRADNYAHLVLDARTGSALEAHNADELRHPASLAKMMTIYVVFEAIRDGRLTWGQRIRVSATAASRIPTKLYAPAGSTITVREAVLGMIVVSANDAATAVAEELAGNEAAFGELMTRRARQLGMASTLFTNASGLPSRAQVTTARDMSVLAIALQRDFPEFYRLFSHTSMTFAGRTRYGHNRLMSRYEGMDGIKTGYTDWSGFNIVSAVSYGNRRVIGVVMGGATAQSRDDRMAELLDRAMPRASNEPGLPSLPRRVSSAAVLVSPRPPARPSQFETREALSPSVLVSLRPRRRPEELMVEFAISAALHGHASADDVPFQVVSTDHIEAAITQALEHP